MTDALNPVPIPEVRIGQGDVTLSREELPQRLGGRFYDLAFDALRNDIDRLMDGAWNGYVEYGRSPRTRKAGYGFADPQYELPIAWLDTRARIAEAEHRSSPRRTMDRYIGYFELYATIYAALHRIRPCRKMSGTWRKVS
jgi:hypothetical protein